jgi:3-phytase
MIAAALLVLAAPLTPVGATSPVPHDADDPAVWINPADPAKSLILGTDKNEETGGLYAWNLDGVEQWKVTPMDRPNNVDIVQSVAAVSERIQRRLRLVSIRPNGTPQDVTGETAVFAHEQGEKGAPMGLAVWSPVPGIYEAVVSPKESPRWRPLQRLSISMESQRMNAQPVGRLGVYSGDPEGEIEAMVIDRERGILFYADELSGIRAWDLRADRALSHFGLTGYEGDREGLAIWRRGGRTLLVSCDQIEQASRLHIWDVTNPSRPVRIATIPTVSDSTDGIEISTEAVSPKYPAGILVMMDSDDRRFQIYDLRDLDRRL